MTPFHLIFLALAGLVGGAIANHAITTWCWNARPISPWIDPSKWLLGDGKTSFASVASRSGLDRIPIVGWIRRRREAEFHGRGFWVRPLLIELSLAIALPCLFLWIVGGGMLPDGTAPKTLAAMRGWLTINFASTAVLVVLMTAATFIDLDERTIPDMITIPGTLLAMVWATVTPLMYLPGENADGFTLVLLNHPFPISNWWFTGRGLASCLAIWSVWCFALADRRVILRRGFAKAVAFFFARITRHWTWKLLVAIWGVGVAFITSVYFGWGDVPFFGLATALMGMAVGGGIVWSIRLVASWAMGREAMGFGDVTLMAMIGAFIGWQGSVIAFFVSPIAAIAIVIIVWIVTRDGSTPFGPYLCAGTLLTLFQWDSFYNARFAVTLSIMGGSLLTTAVIMLVLLGVMLGVWRLVKTRWLSRMGPSADR